MIQSKTIKLILLPVLIAIHPSFAQNLASIHGSVTDQVKRNIDDGIVTLLRQEDSNFVALSQISQGRFAFAEIARGRYLIKISCPGCKQQYTGITLPGDDSLTISVQQNKSALKEVEITGYKQSFSYKNGNIKAIVENTTLSTLPDATEILARLPTIQVSSDREHVSVVGKGEPLIYLDDQPITINELSTLAVSDIKAIEVINHPSAKYESDGRAVIVVSRKKNTREGTKIDAAETATKKRYFENRFGVNGSIKTNKTEWKVNVVQNFATRFEGLDGVLRSATNLYDGRFNGTSIGPRFQYLWGAGMYKQLNETDYISVNANGRIQNELSDVNTFSTISQNNSTTDALTKIMNKGSRPFVNANLNYQKSLKKINAELFTGCQYSQYRTDVNSNIGNNFNNTSLTESELRRQNFKVDVGAVKIDLTKKIRNNITWESGGSASMSRSNSIFYINYITANDILSSKYLYNENNQALYTQFSGVQKKIEWQTGLRLENTVIAGRLNDSDKLLVDRKFDYLFPKANISYRIDSQKRSPFIMPGPSTGPIIQLPIRLAITLRHSWSGQTTSTSNPILRMRSPLISKPSTISLRHRHIRQQIRRGMWYKMTQH